MQKLYDRGHVSLDWIIQNARYPNKIVVRECDAGPSGKEAEVLIIRHPTPEQATPRQPPATEPVPRQALYLSAQEKETINLSMNIRATVESSADRPLLPSVPSMALAQSTPDGAPSHLRKGRLSGKSLVPSGVAPLTALRTQPPSANQAKASHSRVK